MADGVAYSAFDNLNDLIGLEAAIEFLRGGNDPAAIRIDLGDGVILEGNEEPDRQDLIARLEAYATFLALAESGSSEDVRPMHSGKPVLHSSVATILDALKNTA